MRVGGGLCVCSDFSWRAIVSHAHHGVPSLSHTLPSLILLPLTEGLGGGRNLLWDWMTSDPVYKRDVPISWVRAHTLFFPMASAMTEFPSSKSSSLSFPGSLDPAC